MLFKNGLWFNGMDPSAFIRRDTKSNPEMLMANKKINRTALLFRTWVKFTWYFLHSMRIRRPWSLPPHTWIRLYCRGFLPNKISMYRFWENDWRPYLNDRQIMMTSHINEDYGIIIDNKLLSGLILSSITRIPQTWAVMRNGNIFLPGSGEVQSLKSLLEKKHKAVLKPTDKNGGKGVALLEYRKGVFLKNNVPVDIDQWEKTLPKSSSFLLTEHIKQSEFSASLYPDTVNTIRILTMQDPDTLIPFIAGAAQRIGTSDSFPVDNVSSGGLACGVDIRTGRLARASRVFMDSPFHWITHHPDTGLEFEGRVIPRWKEICDETIRLASLLPMIPYIAWDIALLDPGICIIETNSWSELSVFQLENPLTDNREIRRFFEHHQIIKKHPPASSNEGDK